MTQPNGAEINIQNVPIASTKITDGTNGTNGTIIAANGKLHSNINPSIPHITENIIPLSHILTDFTQFCIKLLNDYVKNLPSNTSSDVTRKKDFLDLIVRIRRDFTKIYVLIKWSVNAKDFTKLIDLLSWLRNQCNYFNELIWGLKSLNPFVSTAKLPNPDLMTALEVLILKRPQLPSHHLIKQKPLSPHTILRTLKDLNVILATRLALNSNLPKKFNNYNIKDGKVKFVVHKEFETSISIATDSIDEKNSPFFLLDFKFLFGTKDHLISDSKTVLPHITLDRLEQISNSLLVQPSGLNLLYEFLHHYSITFKLYLINKQLSFLQKTTWQKNLHYTYDPLKFLIKIFYWNNKNSLKSYLEIGINKDYELNFRWFKEGVHISNNTHSIKFDDEADLNIEWLLQQVTVKHSEIAIREVYDNLDRLLQNNDSKVEDNDDDLQNDSIISLVNPYQIKINLTMQNSILISIDNLSGRFYLINPSPIMNKFITSLNQDPSTDSVSYSILKLRLEINKIEINNKMVITNWIINDVIKISSQEFEKLNIKLADFEKKHFSLEFFRRKFWPQGWFLINFINGLSFNINWYVGKLKSKNGSWIIEWFETCDSMNSVIDLNYESLSNLSSLGENLIISHLIIEELSLKKIQLVNSLVNPAKFELILQNFHKNFDQKTNKNGHLIVIENSGLLPLTIVSKSLFLKLKLKNGILNLTLYGKFSENVNLNDFNDPWIVVNKNNIFEINDNFETLNSNENNLLNNLFTKVEKLSNILIQLNEMLKLDVLILKNSLDFIQFKYDSEIATLRFFNRSDKAEVKTEPDPLFFDTVAQVRPSIELELGESNPHKFCELQLLDILKIDGVSALILTLKRTLSLVKSLKKINELNETILTGSNNFIKFNSANLAKLNFQTNCLEINNFEMLYYVTSLQNNKITRDKIMFNIQLKNKGANKLMYHIRFKESANKLVYLKKLFDKNSKLAHTNGLIVPLGNSIACDIEAIYDLLFEIHDKTTHYFLNEV